ncbi:MAG: 2-oxo acid dehydrogenase subunit E2 [Anaerolineales bacterium]|nr:2-oxo acid dehydrogenase subunit E2 [Anaerolineales bacterium]
MDDIGRYEERRFPEFRNPTIDTLDLGKKKHHIPLLLEIDVTQARQFIQELKVRTGERLSLTGWVVACIGKAVSEHRHMHAMRKGRKSLVLFEDVDISVLVERSVGDSANTAETLPMPYIVRRANKKTVKEISDEIRNAQKASLQIGEVQVGSERNVYLTRVFTRMPRFLRNLLVWRNLMRDPFKAKRMMGTVVVTSVGNLGNYSGYGWGIPIGIHPLFIALGNIARKPGVIGDEISIREMLSMTVFFDHEVTDGGPAVRFIRRLNKLMEQGFGLERQEEALENNDQKKAESIG